MYINGVFLQLGVEATETEVRNKMRIITFFLS